MFDPPVPTSQVLGLQAWATTYLCGAENQSQGFVHAQWNYTPNPPFVYLKTIM